MLCLYGKKILNQSINPQPGSPYGYPQKRQHKGNQQCIKPDLTKKGGCLARLKAVFHSQIAA